MAKLKNAPPVGTKVRLTGAFLRSTGQVAGGEGERRWTVMPCDCVLCRDGFVAIDEPADQSYYEDLPPEQRPRWRHVALGNLEIAPGGLRRGGKGRAPRLVGGPYVLWTWSPAARAWNQSHGFHDQFDAMDAARAKRDDAGTRSPAFSSSNWAKTSL